MWIAITQHCRMKISKCPNNSTAEELDPPPKWTWGPEQTLNRQAFENPPEDLGTLRKNCLTSDFKLTVSLEAISSTLHIYPMFNTWELLQQCKLL